MLLLNQIEYTYSCARLAIYCDATGEIRFAHETEKKHAALPNRVWLVTYVYKKDCYRPTVYIEELDTRI
jgi:hypothetical protein